MKKEPGVSHNELQEGAMKIHCETGHGRVRDIESEIFAKPVRHSFNVDYEGDTLNYMPEPPTPKNRTTKVIMRRLFNNMSLKRKNQVRKIRKQLKQATKRSAAVMLKNMEPLHHNSRLKFDSRLVK